MFYKFFITLRDHEAGATMVEYGIAVVLAVIVGSTALITLSSSISGNITAASNEMDVLEEN